MPPKENSSASVGSIGVWDLTTNKIEAAARKVHVFLLSGLLDHLVVTAYPKSGATWLSGMIAAAVGKPYPTNRIPPLRPCVLQGHYLPSSVFAPLMDDPVVMFRDGRDIMVSYYFFSLFPNEDGDSAAIVRKTRREVPFEDYDNVKKNMSAFVDYQFRPTSEPDFTWSQFVNRWLPKDPVQVRYEDLLDDCFGEMKRLLSDLGADELSDEALRSIVASYSFENQSQRRRGTEERGSVMRKGISGDWKNYFDREARRVFDRHGGEELIRLGYENDRSWVQ